MTMQLGFIGGKKPERLQAAAELAKEVGFAGLEFDYWNEFEVAVNDDAVKQMGQTLKQYGVGVSAYGIWGYNPISPNPDERAHALQVVDRAIRYAATLGARVMVLSTGDMPHEPLGRKIAEFLQVFPPILEQIKSAGMKAAFYALHGNTFLRDLAACERLWEQRADALLKYDPANWRLSGHDYLDVVRRYGNKIGHVHIKEVICDAKGHVVSQPPAGMGEIEWGKVLTFLHEHNYDGYLSIEPHMAPWMSGEGLRKNLILSKRYLSQFLL